MFKNRTKNLIQNLKTYYKGKYRPNAADVSYLFLISVIHCANINMNYGLHINSNNVSNFYTTITK